MKPDPYHLTEPDLALLKACCGELQDARNELSYIGQYCHEVGAMVSQLEALIERAGGTNAEA